MDKYQAINDFFESFGLTAYEENSVPIGDDAPAFPYITYALNTSYALDELLLPFSLWYRSTSQREINLKTADIAQAVGMSKVLTCDEGAVILRPGTPFAQGMSDDSDPMVKRKLINLTAKFVTIY